MNAAQDLTSHVLSRIEAFEALEEVLTDNDQYRRFHHPETNKEVGGMRLFNGSDKLDKVVVVNIIAEAMEMDAYMVMAFTKTDSLVPHLAFDCEIQPHDSAFHIDLIHKKEFSTDIDYIQAVMEPLSDAFNASQANADYRFSDATLLMKALLNPWMASYHMAPEHLPTGLSTIDAYMDHWMLLANDDTILAPFFSHSDAIAAYDQAHRDAMFDRRVDILWDVLAGVIGTDNRDLILKLVKGAPIKEKPAFEQLL